MAATSSSISADESALRLCGLSRVSVATPAATSSRTRGSRHGCGLSVGVPRIIAPAGPGQTGTRAEHPSRRRARPGRRRAATRPRCAGVGRRGFGAYVHVPFCASRCGYCDFNTYTPAELGGAASMDSYGRRRSWPRSSWPRGCWAASAPPAGHGVRRRRDADPAARRRAGPDPGRARQGLRARRRRGGHHRGESGVGGPDPVAAAARGPGSPGSRWACSRPPRTSSRCSTAGTHPDGPPRPRDGGPCRPGSST